MAALAVVKGLKEKRTGAKSDQAILIFIYNYFFSNSHLYNLHILTSSHLEAGSSPDPELPRPQQQPQDQAGGLHRHHGRAQC